MCKGNKIEKKHLFYTDLLRILALLGIMLVHVSAYQMENPEANASQLVCMRAWDSLTVWAMPLFVMISGVFFLDPSRKVDYGKIWRHNISRIALAFVGWSFFYAVCTVILSPQKDDWPTFLTEFIKGHYHMWFLFMMIGLYAVVPILRRIMAEEKTARLFLLVIGITGFFLPGIRNLVAFLEERGTADYVGANIVHQLLDSLDLLYRYNDFGYMLFYFAAGYWFSRIVVKRKGRAVLIVILLAAGCVSVLYAVTGWAVPGAIVSTGWLAPLCTSAVFLLGRAVEENPIPDRLRNAAKRGGRNTFGAYLVHAAVIEALASPVGLSSLTFNAAFSIPVTVAVTFVISMAASEILHHIPVLKHFV